VLGIGHTSNTLHNLNDIQTNWSAFVPAPSFGAEEIRAVWGDRNGNIAVISTTTSYHYNSQQNAWSSTSLGGTYDVQDVVGVNQHCLFVAHATGVLKGSSSGWSESLTTNVDTSNRVKIWAYSDSLVYFAGGGYTNVGNLYRWNGSNWTKISDPILTNRSVDCVWGFSPSQVYIGGEPGYMAEWDGNSWSLLPSIIPTATPQAIWGTGPGDIWMAGQENISNVLKAWNYINGSWLGYSIGAGETVPAYEIWGGAGNSMFVTSPSGSGGQVWKRELDSPTFDEMSGGSISLSQWVDVSDFTRVEDTANAFEFRSDETVSAIDFATLPSTVLTQYFRESAELLGCTDAAARLVSSLRNSPEQESTLDSVSKQVDFLRPNDDVVTSALDAINLYKGYARRANEENAATESASRATLNVREASEFPVAYQGTTTRVSVNSGRLSTEVGQAEDSARRLRAFNLGVAEVVSATDTAGTDRIDHVRERLEWILSVDGSRRDTESYRNAVELEPFATDRFKLLKIKIFRSDETGVAVDTIKTPFHGSQERDNFDNTEALDFPSRSQQAVRLTTELVGMVDTAAAAVGFHKRSNDTAGVTDTPTFLRGYQRPNNDLFEADDRLRRKVSSGRVLAESPGTVDTARLSAALFRAVDDTLSPPTDAISRAHAAVRSNQNVAATTDLASRATQSSRADAAVAGATDTFILQQGQQRRSDENVSPVVGETASTAFARLALDSVSADAVGARLVEFGRSQDDSAQASDAKITDSRQEFELLTVTETTSCKVYLGTVVVTAWVSENMVRVVAGIRNEDDTGYRTPPRDATLIVLFGTEENSPSLELTARQAQPDGSWEAFSPVSWHSSLSIRVSLGGSCYSGSAETNAIPV
jgi:hypothetical protein